MFFSYKYYRNINSLFFLYFSQHDKSNEDSFLYTEISHLIIIIYFFIIFVSYLISFFGSEQFEETNHSLVGHTKYGMMSK